MTKSKYTPKEKKVLNAFAARGILNTHDIREMDIWQPPAVIYSLKKKGLVFGRELKDVWVGAKLKRLAHYQIVGGRDE